MNPKIVTIFNNKGGVGEDHAYLPFGSRFGRDWEEGPLN